MTATPARQQRLLELLAVGVLIGWTRLARKDGAARRVLLLGLAAFVGHFLAQLVVPALFLPQRYVQYSVPVLAILLAGTFWSGLSSNSRLVPVLGSVVTLCVFAANGSSKAGMNVVVRSHEENLYDTIAQLPKNAVIAGWPGRMNNVPYFTRRSVLLSWELHMPFHTRFTELLRDRMRALIRAQYAVDRAPLDELRSRYGVTHLFFDTRDFRRQQPYFRPFERDISAALLQARNKPWELERQIGPAAVWRRGNGVLLDLSKLAP